MNARISHHPDGATLVSYAAATLAEPLAAVVASHLSMCPACRREIADLELLGAALMQAVAAEASAGPVTLPNGRAETVAERQKHVGRRDEKLPAALVAVYDIGFDRIPWRRLGPGAWHHRLALRQVDVGDLRLMRIAPGRKMPEHGHGGSELTLVLDGSYSDVTGAYHRGDVQDVDEGVEHQPVISMDGECVCLIASIRPARFKTLMGRLSQPWTGL